MLTINKKMREKKKPREREIAKPICTVMREREKHFFLLGTDSR